MGTIDLLAKDGPLSEVREIDDFVVLEGGRVVFLRDSFTDPEIVALSADGSVRARVALPNLEGAYWESLASLGDDRFVVAANYSGYPSQAPQSRVRVVDLASGEVRPMADGPEDPLRNVIALSHGGFAVASGNAESSRVEAYDPEGKLEWSLGSEDGLGRVDEICRTSDDRLALLEVTRNAGETTGVRFVFSSGQVGPLVLLRKSWRSEEADPWGIQPAPGGGIYFGDHSGPARRIVRMDSGGNLVSQRIPRYADGLPIPGRFRVDPEGRIWVTDAYAFLRLREDGVAEHVAGERREARKLRRTRRVRVDPEGLVYAVAERDRTIHIFDAGGRRLRVIEAAAFDPAGDPSAGLEKVAWVLKDDRLPPRADGRRWQLGRGKIRLVSADGRIVREITRDGAGMAVYTISCAACAADGSLAVAAGGRILVLGPDADERARFDLPGIDARISSIAYDGSRVALAQGVTMSGEDWIHVFSAAGEPLFRMPIPPVQVGCGMDPIDHTWKVYLVRSRNEIWLRKGDDATRIFRHALP